MVVKTSHEVSMDNFGSRSNATTPGCCHHCRWTLTELQPLINSNHPFIFVSIDVIPSLGRTSMRLKKTRIRHPKVGLFDIKKRILNWSQLRSGKCRKSSLYPLFCLKTGHKFCFYWRQTLISPQMAPEESTNNPYPLVSWQFAILGCLKSLSSVLSLLCKSIILCWRCCRSRSSKSPFELLFVKMCTAHINEFSLSICLLRVPAESRRWVEVKLCLPPWPHQGSQPWIRNGQREDGLCYIHRGFLPIGRMNAHPTIVFENLLCDIPRWEVGVAVKKLSGLLWHWKGEQEFRLMSRQSQWLQSQWELFPQVSNYLFSCQYKRGGSDCSQCQCQPWAH